MEVLSPKSKNRKMFSFKKTKVKEVEMNSFEADAGYSSASGSVSASSTFSYKGSMKRKNKKTKKQLTPETVLNIEERKQSSSSTEDIKTSSDDDVKSVSDEESFPESDRMDKKGYKSVERVLEIPLIHDGYGWLSGLAGPYLDTALTVVSPLMTKVDTNTRTRAALDKLMDITDRMDSVAADYIDYILDNYPAVKKPTWSFWEQFTVGIH